jgi:ABC-type Zn uptake system ZnuABC Zn-binding protein ZnuA
MKKFLIFCAVLMFTAVVSVVAEPVKIVAAIPDLGSIASYIGGDKVEVIAIAKNNSNPHFVEVLPSYMIKVLKGDIYLKAGLSLDQWSNEIIDGSRNNKIIVADCSNGIAVLQKPVGKVDSSMGDVHPEGNPHYWLDPENGIVIASNILAALKKADSLNSAYYESNFEKFKNETKMRIAVWKDKMSGLSGKKMISYHSSWVYFASAFNMVIAGYVEPLPGIPPTGKHLSELVNIIKKDKVSLLIQEPYFPDNAPKFLERQTGIKVFKIAPSCTNVKADSYFKHFDETIAQITK